MRLTPEKDLRKIHLPVAPFETPCNPKPNFSPFYLCEVFVLVAPSVSAWFKHQPAARKSPVSMSCNGAEQLWFHDQSSEYRRTLFLLSILAFKRCLPVSWLNIKAFPWTLHKDLRIQKKHLSYWAILEKLFPEGNTRILQSSPPTQKLLDTASTYYKFYAFSYMFFLHHV